MKVVLLFKEIFWDALPQARHANRQLIALPQLSFLFSNDPVMATWWTPHPVVAPMLTGWAAGPRAARMATMTSEEIADEAVVALSRTLGIGRSDLDQLVMGRFVHNWSADPYSRGGYSYVCAGGLTAPGALAEPVDETLFFAGEATDTQGETGTVHAALQTGYRAAAEIARALASTSAS